MRLGKLRKRRRAIYSGLRPAKAVAGVVCLFSLLGLVNVASEAYRAHSDKFFIQGLSLLFIGIPVAVFAVLLILTPRFERIRSYRTLYAITNRRLIAMRGAGEGGVDAIDLTAIDDISWPHGGDAIPITDIDEISSPGACGTQPRDLRVTAKPDTDGAPFIRLVALADASEVEQRLRELSSLAVAPFDA